MAPFKRRQRSAVRSVRVRRGTTTGLARLQTLALGLALSVLPTAFAADYLPCELTTPDGRGRSSESCLGCHGGHSASKGAPALSRTHPIDIPYESSYLRRPSAYRAVGDLPGALRLDGGKLTCGTCHDGAAMNLGRTALPMARSELCTGCHVF